MNEKNRMDSVKFLLEVAPLVLFFIAYHYFGLMAATLWMVGSTACSTICLLLLRRKLPLVPLFSAGLLLIFGSITLISGDVTYIKMKPTFINLLFAIILLGGALMKKGLLKHIMGSNLVLPDKIWIDFSIRWAIFFCLLAGLNEYVWRHFPEEIWVKFKVFGLLALTILFTFSQIPYISKHRITES